METLDVQTMQPNKYEPKRTFRWLFTIEGIDNFMMKRVTRPSFVWCVDKYKVNDITFEMYDPIAPCGAQQIHEWMDARDKREATIKMLDPIGTVVEHWNLKGLKLLTADFGTLDYACKDGDAIIDWINAQRYFSTPDSFATITCIVSCEEAKLKY